MLMPWIVFQGGGPFSPRMNLFSGIHWSRISIYRIRRSYTLSIYILRIITIVYRRSIHRHHLPRPRIPLILNIYMPNRIVLWTFI
jgi:hypothetical protein